VVPDVQQVAVALGVAPAAELVCSPAVAERVCLQAAAPDGVAAERAAVQACLQAWQKAAYVIRCRSPAALVFLRGEGLVY
jgi:hypothetical protein